METEGGSCFGGPLGYEHSLDKLESPYSNLGEGLIKVMHIRET